MKPTLSSRTSLPEVHSSVSILRPTLIRRVLAYAGPAYLVSVGYMDPGNWATDLEGGARFGYQLLWVLVLSNAMAILLQTLSARLGIVGGRDLAQACREYYSRPVCNALWVLCEIAIAACDLAEVLGAAIALMGRCSDCRCSPESLLTRLRTRLLVTVAFNDTGSGSLKRWYWASSRSSPDASSWS